MDFSVLPSIIVFGLGVLIGVILFARISKKCLENHRSKTIYFIIGLMIGSIFSIINGPKTLGKDIIDFSNFSIIFFIIGGIVILLLELIKNFLKKSEQK